MIRDILDSETGEFENRYVTSAEFRHAYPVLAEFSLGQIGRSIGKIRVNRPEIQKKEVYVPEEHKYENRFLIPMPKLESPCAGVGYKEAIRRSMAEHDMNEEELACLIGVPKTTVWMWMGGAAVPSSGMFDKLRVVFGKDFLRKGV